MHPPHGVGETRRVAPEQFLISFWCAPPSAETTPERYREIADAGFNAVLPPCAGPVTPELNRRILELCAANGLKVIIGDPRLAAAAPAPGGTAVDSLVERVVSDYAKSPALLLFAIS